MLDRFNFTGFTIENFRVFGEPTSFDISPLTILTGTNSSGKSSFTKALNLLTKSYKGNGLRKLELMGNNLHLGGYDSIKNFNYDKDEISFCLEGNIDDMGTLEKYSISLSYKSQGLISTKIIKNNKLILSFGIEYDNLVNTFIKLPIEIIKKNELQKIFSKADEIEFQCILKNIMNFLQNNQDAHRFTREGSDIMFFIDDIINTSAKEIIRNLQYVGKTYEDSFMGQDNEIDKAKYDYNINPQFIDIFEDSNIYYN